jgi:uncharacterized membrane protein
MNRFKGAHYLLCLALLLGVFGGLLGGQVVLAAQGSSQAFVLPPPAQEEPPSEEPAAESLEIYSTYPVLQDTAGKNFEFEITLFYQGSEPKTFDLNLTSPEGWTGVFLGGYPETEISAFTVEPGRKRETVTLIVGPMSQQAAAVAGEYVFTVEAASGDVSDSTEIKAVVVTAPPEYLLYLSTATLVREFNMQPNQDNHVSLQLTNSASGTVDNIIFSAEGPSGWDITFTPGSLATLESGVTQEIDLVIKPPAGTESGDYPVIISAVGDEAEMSRELRITVATTSIWGQAGIGIAVAVIVALAIWFRRAGRREEAKEAATATGSGNWFKRAVSRLRRGGSR